MSRDNPRDRCKPEPIETFEEKWSRRAASWIAAAGLATVGALLFQGFEAERIQSGQNCAGELPYREFVEQYLESRMRRAYDLETGFDPRQLSEARRRRLIEDFKRCPLYDKIARDTVRWFEENRRLVSVAKNDLFEKNRLAQYLSERLFEIKDAAFIANLGNTPEGRFLLGRMSRTLSQDRSCLVVSYGNVIVHSDCFINVKMTDITDIDLTELMEQEQADFGR
jgi:hypothetical protein